MTNWQWAATVIVNLGLGVMLAEFVRGFFHRKNMDANTAKQLAETAALLVQPLENRVKSLSADLETTEGRATNLAAQLLEALDEVAQLRRALEDTQRALEGAQAEIRDLRRNLQTDQTDAGPHAPAP